MLKLIVPFLSAALLLLSPTFAHAHCGSCGAGDEAAEGHDGAHGDCAACAGDADAECTCAHAGEGEAGHGDCAACAGDADAECTCGHGDEGAEAADGEAADDAHANCAFCQGDETAECTCH